MALFKKLTTDGILADFTKKVTQLEQVANEQAAAIEKQNAAIAAAEAAKTAAAAEQAKALAAAEKIRSFFA